MNKKMKYLSQVFTLSVIANDGTKTEIYAYHYPFIKEWFYINFNLYAYDF